ncbi:MAG: ribosome small subunit-dependent GTPase A [Clostridiaceae bacterium]|nr:ribosome small subunit-dependent GTPase A [Clostridiaceae bacterium]
MIDLSEYGYLIPDTPLPPDTIPARITAVHKERYGIVCPYGETYARLKTAVYYNGYAEFPTVGDFVAILYNPAGDSLVTSTLPRRTFFSRRDPTPGRGEQAVAANFDYVFLMQSLNHDFNPKRLERYLTLAWQSGAAPVVILTKADLVDDCTEPVRRVRNLSPGIEVFPISAVSGYGIDALTAYLRSGKTVVFLGSSGVGKSSLLNVLAGHEVMATAAIREDDSRGRHTTTHRELLRLPGGVMIIDTPGMRELGMWDVSVGLGEAFSDVEPYLHRCRFTDCTHENEPGCAVKAAIASGELSQARWDSYKALKSEAKYADDPAAYLRRKQQWHKDIAKTNKQRQKDARRYGGKRDDD